MDRSELAKLKQKQGSAGIATPDVSVVDVTPNAAVDVDPQDIYVKGVVRGQKTMKDHSKLDNLDYANSGHTGFASEEDLDTQVLIDETLSVLPPEAIAALKRNSTIQLLFHDNLYSLSVRSGRNWTYMYIEKSTGSINTIIVDVDSGAFDISSSNPIQSNLDSHINDTSVHLQTGERIAWNNKVSARVDETEEKLIFSSEV